MRSLGIQGVIRVGFSKEMQEKRIFSLMAY